MKRPARILQVNPAFNNDAPSQGAAALAKYLDPTEFHVTAVSLRPRLGLNGTVTELEASGIQHVSLGIDGFFDVRVLARLVQFMRRVRPDIVHTHAFRADLWAGLAARMAGVPIVVSSIRNNDWDCFRTEQPFPVARLAMAGSKIAVSFADILIAVSEGVREHLVSVQKISPVKIRVIPNGVDLERLGRLRSPPQMIRGQLNLAPGTPLVGTLAVFKPRKGLSYLVEAARAVLSRYPYVHFLLAGDGPEREAVEKQIQRLGIARNMHLLGFRDDAIALVDALDIYVLPSLFEGFPRSVLEAMGLGKPVIVTDIGGSREAVRHGASGLIVPPRDPQGLAEAICRLLESPQLRKSMGEAGRQAVQECFNARINAASHQELYRELLRVKEVT